MTENRERGSRIERYGAGYLVTIYGTRGDQLVHVSRTGRLSNASGAPIRKSDVMIICALLGEVPIKDKIVAWWHSEPHD